MKSYFSNSITHLKKVYYIILSFVKHSHISNELAEKSNSFYK